MRVATHNLRCAPASILAQTKRQNAGQLWLLTLLMALVFILPASAQAQGNYVYVNNQAAANTVSAYSVSSSGGLTELPGSPFSTGGAGANVVCYGLNRITLSPANNLLFVANTGDRTISSFQINPANGNLTAVAGSPFASGLTLDTCQGISLAATPDGKFLMASSNGQIQTFTIGASGALSLLGTTANCCSPNASMVISPNGQFLAVSNETSVSMFVINAVSGALTPVLGSPFPKTGSGILSGLDFSCAADRLYGGEATGSPALLDAWTINTTSGALTPVPGTPFQSTGNNSNIVLYSPDNTLLFQTNQFSNSVNPFMVNPDGALANVGKFGGTTQVHTPAGMATDATGTFLYVADDTFGVAVFRIGNSGVLASLGDLAINRPGEIQDLVAYPPRSCTSADLALSMTAVPATAPAGAPVQYQVTITNKGPSVSSAVVADTFPPTLTAGGNSPIVNPAGAKRVNTISGNTVTGNVTITTTVANQLFAGETVTVSSVPAPTTPNPIQSGFFLTDPAFNGVFTITSVPSPNSFTYTQALTVSQFPQPVLNIVASTGAQRVGNTVTITATAPFQLTPGTQITIAGVANPSFNGTFPVASQPSATKFTYAQAGPDAISGGGTATAPTVVPPTDAAGGGSASNAACLVTTGPGTCGQANFAPKPPIVAGTGANRSGNVVTITTTVPHQIFAGQTAVISGVANTSFNGSFVVASVPSPTTFTYKQTAANAVSGGGSVTTPATAAQLITFPALASGETRSALLTATTKTTLTNGTIINNTANITNKSTVDPNPADDSATAAVTIGAQTATTLTVPTATGPYGGNATVTATLKTSGGTPVAGETIGFNFNQNNSVYNAVTNASGVATVIVPLGFTTVGTHPAAFTVTFGGDASFGPSSATGDLIVTKAQLTVTADNKSRLYGDPNPPLTYTITGFVNGDTIAVVSGAADCSTTATPASPVGAYPITCAVGTLSAQNYVFAFVAGILTVNPAPLTVTVNNATRAYGDPNPAFSGTITGIKNGDNITATYSTAATITSPAGTYPITATLSDNGTGALTNYTVTINNGTLTITQAALIVTANNAARLYGDPNPAFSGTIAGIKNGDNITAIYTTPATPASPVGTYPIIPTLSDNGTGALANYIVTVNNGSLTVSQAPLSVTAANATRAYGAPNPVFTGTIVGLKNADNITATYSTPATTNSPAGTYPIIPALVDPTNKLGNYTVTINNGTLTVTTAVLTVTAANASRLYGDPNPVFTGTITGIQNGDNITATYASVADPTSPVGTYAIVPTLSDNGTGKLANYVVVSNNGVLAVNPAPLTVTVGSFSRLYGDPNPAFSVTIVGIKNGDSITAALSTTATAASPVGTYPITATLIDPTNKLGNYAVTINNGTLTINPAPLSVTAANASRLFGTPNPRLSGIITGIKNGDPITATYSTTAIATSPVGTYPITPTLVDPAGKLGNYTVTSINGTLTVNSAPTANFVFVNNQAATGNSIAGYSVAVDGTLTALAGSPVATGGLGANAACSSVNRLALSAGNNLLFVSNGGDRTISAFQINPASGGLTAAAGSPFASGLTLDACSGISLSATPDGRFLMASSNGQIATFSIGTGGVLSSLFTAANPVTPNAGMKISANGQFLAVSNGASASVFSINPDGSLTAAAGSPFAKAGTGSLAGLDFSSTSGLLYGAEASPTAALADAWTIGANGALSAVAGSPFSTTAINSNVVLLSPNDAFLFASNQGSNSISSFNVAAGGGLTSIGSFGSAASLHAPVGMATDRSGSLLFVADDTFGVAVFRISGVGSLAQLGDVAIAGAGQVQDLVAYPPRMASSADLSVAISAASPNVVAGQNVTYTITVTNNGADPAAATVADSLPSGFSLVSCTATGNGACITNSAAASFYLLQSGESQTATIVAQTSLSIPDGTITTNTASISNSSAVDPNAANNSANATVTVAQPATTTLAVAPASGTYGGSTTLSATLSIPAGPLSGKTVSFTLNGSPAGSAVTGATGVASVPASLVGIAAGSYPAGVTASFAGDPNNKATSGSAALTVNPAVLTVTAANASRIYGDPNPTFSFNITGFVNGETAAVVSGSPSCTSTDPTSAVGSYPIVCTIGTLSAANYSFSFVNGTLTVTPAALSVTAANASRVYGDPNPVFTGTITGIKNGDNITATYTTTATAASPVGTYPITPALVDPASKLGNYTVTSTNGTLTVTPAPLSVVAANATRFYGDPNPVFTGTITGIKNADNITATYATTAVATSPVGTYPITPTLVDPTAKLSNYTVTSTNGTLTVSPAPLTVTAANASRVYGDPNPAFTGTITGIRNGENITATYATTATQTSPVGTYPITPTVSDNATGALANYTVTTNNGTLTITQAPLTVTVANATRLYGAANPAFTGTITGLKNTDSITATYSTTATAASSVGTYPITPTLADPAVVLPNYAVTTNNGTLTITPAPLTVTAANATRVYGDANPAFSGTITGLLNGDNITATYATTAIATSPVGSYPITPTLVDPAGKLGNYTVTSNNGTLTVSSAPLTVTAANATRAFGDPNPVFTGTIVGIKNNDNISASYSTTATVSSPVGTYPITPVLADPTGKLGNYTVTLNNGTLTVTNSVLTVTAANASRFYGDPNPAFTGTIIGLKNGDNITATFSSAATATSAPGAYAIVPALVDPNNRAGNYTVVLNNGVLTVNAAPLSVTAANASRAYGAANPVFTGTITGLKNGDNITASYTTVADPTSNVGSYVITPLLSDPTNKLSNYAVTLTNGALTITQVPLTVTANNATRVYGDPNPAFTGTITGLLNGDNITFSATSAAPTAAVGTYPIVPALVDPNGKLVNYTVTSNNGTLTVTPAPLSVAAANATRAYGDPNPAFTGTLTGVKNGDNITATYSTTAVATSTPGTYPITPALADPTAKLGNYTVTSTNGTLTVTTATLTVSAANATMIYGDPVPALTGTITGLKNGDAITATFSTTATSASPVGTYPITSTLSDPTGKLANYTVASNNGVLTISPAPLTVAAANATRAYGSANPAFTGTLTGVKNGDNITATFASATGATTNVGTYPIVPTLVDPTAKLGNYTVTSTNGTLTITQVPLTVTANNASRVYGDPNPAFAGTITGLLNGDNITFSATSADPTAAVGTYPIVPALVDPTGKLVNYTVTSNNGTLTVTPAPLSVAAANATRAYGDPNNLSGTITGIKNGDNITATYSTTATATSAPGTYPITPTLVDPTAKLGNYTVTSTNGTLTVTTATLTVTAANASMLYGDPVPALSGTITGIKNGDNITASYSTTATSTSAPGTYPITPTLADPTGKLPNYTVVINNGTLTISPAPLTVTAANASRLYGDPNPAFTGTITGLKNGDTIGAVFSAAADPTSPVGNYAIIPTLSDPNNKLGNYSVTINNGVLTVNPAPLSVTADSTSRLYGDPNPAFTGTIVGIKNGDNITATYSSTAGPTSTVGTYPIVPALVDPTNKVPNYTVTSTNGTLTVNPAPLTIQANNATGTAGQPFPPFSGTITGLKNTDVITASYSTTATSTSPAGTYPIIPSADPNPLLVNYSVTLINGTLTLQ